MLAQQRCRLVFTYKGVGCIRMYGLGLELEDGIGD